MPAGAGIDLGPVLRGSVSPADLTPLGRGGGVTGCGLDARAPPLRGGSLNNQLVRLIRAKRTEVDGGASDGADLGKHHVLWPA